MTKEEAVALLERYSNYDGMGIPNLAGCKEAMKVAVDALKEAFPQLAESDDERIRKAIIRIIKNSNIIDINVSEKQMLAYLEKQKESLRDFIDDFPYSAQKEQKPIKVLYIPKFRTGDLVRSSKNPRLTYKILSAGSMNELGNPEYEVEIFTDGKPDEPRNLKHIEIEKMDSWGELIKQKPLLPEDKVKHPLYVEGFEEGKEVGRQCEKVFGKPKEQKPAWSEEDEKIRQSIIKDIEFERNYSSATTGEAIEKYNEQIAWLKSLRSSWKHNEE